MLENNIIEESLYKGKYRVVFKAKNKADNKIYLIKKKSLLDLNENQKKEVKLESNTLNVKINHPDYKN